MGRSKTVALVYPVVFAVLATLAACGDSSVVSVADITTPDSDTVDSHTAHTDIADGIWPPQPLGITHVEGYPASARAGAERSVVDSARRVLMNNPETREALGDNFRQFDGSLGSGKSDITASFVFYNYSNNTTVEAELSRNGNVNIEVYPAIEWQPPEHSEEVAQAIALGRESLIADGYETAGLVGTAMLAFPQISQIDFREKHYFAERKLYVTFGEGDGEIPVYSALVNLSSGSVSESGLVR